MIISDCGCRRGASLADDAIDRLRRLCTHGQPLICDGEVYGVIGAFHLGVVGAELLDVAAIAALAAVNGDDFVVRAVLGALAVESERYGHDNEALSVPKDGRARKLQDPPQNAKQNLDDF